MFFQSFITKFQLYCVDGKPNKIKDHLCFYIFLSGTLAAFVATMLIDYVGRRAIIYALLLIGITGSLLIQFDNQILWIISINLSSVTYFMFFSVIFIYIGEVMTVFRRSVLTQVILMSIGLAGILIVLLNLFLR